MSFKKADPRINRRGRPPVGLSFADRVRSLVGSDGGKLADMWFGIAYQLFPEQDGTSSRIARIAALETLSKSANTTERILCSRLLAERGFGKPKETHEVNGTLNAVTRVVHEYHDK